MLYAFSQNLALEVDSVIVHSAYFNPRTLMGCDRQETVTDKRKAIFQSTHPRGVRLYMEKI